MPYSGLSVELLAFGDDLWIFQVITVVHVAIDNAVRREFDDSRREGFDHFPILRDQKQSAFIDLKAVVKGGDRLQIQMVGRLIEKEDVRLHHHDARKETTNLLAPGEHVGLLEDFEATEEHLAEETAKEFLFAFHCFFRELTKPFDEAQAVLEHVVVILGEVAPLRRNTPAELAAVRSDFTLQEAEEEGGGFRVSTNESDAFAAFDREIEATEHLSAVFGSAEMLDVEKVLTGFAFLLEYDMRVAPG